MALFTINFRTTQPVPFKEHCSDVEFYAEVCGNAKIAYYNEISYGVGKEAENALRELILGMIPGCFAAWPEGKLIMGPGNREILEDLLAAILASTGTDAKLDIRSIGLVKGQMDKYMAECREALDEQMNPQVSTEDLEEEKHGPLISFSLNYSSHGMMAGSSSSSGDDLEWNKDGTVTLTSSHSGGGKNTRFRYNVKPEIAQKMRDYVTENHLARLSKEDIKTPVMFDNFTSASFSMSFDDSSIGGSSYEHCFVNCGPAGMTFRNIENALGKILDECRETGECILNEETQTGSGFPGMGGMMGMGNFPGMMPRPPKEAWTCPSCGQEGITSRFCPQCAAPAPDVTVHPTIFAMDPPPAPGETWTCACGQEGNTGKFCPSCGNPSPAYLAQFEIKPDQRSQS
ncbi:MAG: hypothetical protein K6E62_10325 [Lachnospiraceae bacterium]|nr:hypothetical protein [Lachnospiraceae bacterium]